MNESGSAQSLLDQLSKDATIRSLESHIDGLSHATIYITSLLALVGLLGNLVSLIIFVNADKHLPKIASRNYLILLTIVNTVYLLTHWYNSTFTRIMINYKLFVTWDLFNTSSIVCRSVGFTKSLCRMLSVLLTMTFSLERLLAIVAPLKVLNIKRHFIKISMLDVLVIVATSIALTCYIFLLTEPVPFESSRIDLDDGRKTIFNKYSLIPQASSQTHCSVPKRNTSLFFKIYLVNTLVLLVAYLITSVSLIVIVVKLTNEQNFVFIYKTRHFDELNNSTSFRSQKRNAYSTCRSLINRTDPPDIDHQDDHQVCRLQLDESHRNSLLNENSSKPEGGSDSTNQRSSVRYTFNKKFQNSVMLVTLAFFFLVLNAPYNLGILIGQAYFQRNPINEDKAMYQEYLGVSIFLYVAEVLMCCNYSLTGLLFFCSGKIFRLHFYQLFRRAF